MYTTLPSLDDYDNYPYGEDPIDEINKGILRGDYDDDERDLSAINLARGAIPLCPRCHSRDIEIRSYDADECNSCGWVF